MILPETAPAKIKQYKISPIKKLFTAKLILFRDRQIQEIF